MYDIFVSLKQLNIEDLKSENNTNDFEGEQKDINGDDPPLALQFDLREQFTTDKVELCFICFRVFFSLCSDEYYSNFFINCRYFPHVLK